MALSGSFYTNVGSNWRLQAEWSASQSISANSSTITVNLYWMGLNQYSKVISSATKDGQINIMGDTKTFSGSGLAGLYAGQKKLLATHTYTTGHNADGTKKVSFSAFFDVDLNLNGSVGRVSVSSGTITLNPIPRTSTLTSSPSWTAGNSLPITISRASTEFVHLARIYVNNTHIKNEYSVPTNRTVTFTEADLTKIYTAMGANETATTKIELETHDGNGYIGEMIYTGTITAPAVSTISVPNNEIVVGDTIAIRVNPSNSNFTHRIRLKDEAVLIKEFTDVGTSVSFNTSEVSSIFYESMSNATEKDMIFWTYSYYNGVQVGQASSLTVNVKLSNAKPVFNANFTYKDINTTATNVTGNNQYIVQGLSNVQVDIPVSALAVGQAGATIVQYVATLGGKQLIANHTGNAISFNFGQITSTQDQTLVIKAVDSRGGTTQSSKTVKMIPYNAPTLNASAKRDNGFEQRTTIAVNGNVSLLTINGVNKNSVQSVKFRYRKTTEGSVSTWNTWSTFTYSLSSNTYTATSKYLDLLITDAYYVEFMVTDRLNSSTILKTVSTGEPTMFIDADKGSVGIGKFPTASKSLEVNGGINASGAITGGSVTADNLNADSVKVGKNTSSPATIEQVGKETRITNGGVYLSIEPVNSSYTEIQTNSNSIDFMSPVNFYSPVSAKNSVDISGGLNVSGDIAVSGQIQNEQFIQASLQNGWEHYNSSVGTGFQRAVYWKDKNGIVHLQGFIRNGTTTSGTVILTLPVGYRPSEQNVFVTANGTAGNGGTTHNPTRIDVASNGQVIGISLLTSSWTSLNGISFKAER